MPFTYTVSKADELARVHGWGRADLYSTVRTLASLTGEPDFEPHYRHLVDVRNMKVYLPMDEIWTVGRVFGGFRDAFRGRQAIVVSSAFNYGTICCVAALARLSGVPLRVFRDMTEAQSWLDEPEPDAVRESCESVGRAPGAVSPSPHGG